MNTIISFILFFATLNGEMVLQNGYSKFDIHFEGNESKNIQVKLLTEKITKKVNKSVSGKINIQFKDQVTKSYKFECEKDMKKIKLNFKRGT